MNTSITPKKLIKLFLSLFFSMALFLTAVFLLWNHHGAVKAANTYSDVEVTE